MEQIEEKRHIGTKLKSFFIQSRRVLKITQKPSKEEFQVIVKVSGLGILLIGLVGFLIHLGWKLLL